MSTGVDDPRPVDHEGFAGGSPRERRNHLKTCMCPRHMCVSVVQGWYRCLHVSPLACMRSNLEAKVLDLYKGESPVTVKSGSIVPQLVNQHGFTSSHDLVKHKTRESYAGLTLSEECLGA